MRHSSSAASCASSASSAAVRSMWPSSPRGAPRQDSSTSAHACLATTTSRVVACPSAAATSSNGHPLAKYSQRFGSPTRKETVGPAAMPQCTERMASWPASGTGYAPHVEIICRAQRHAARVARMRAARASGTCGEMNHAHTMASPANRSTSPEEPLTTSMSCVKYSLILRCNTSISSRVQSLVKPEMSTKRSAASSGHAAACSISAGSCWVRRCQCATAGLKAAYSRTCFVSRSSTRRDDSRIEDVSRSDGGSRCGDWIEYRLSERFRDSEISRLVVVSVGDEADLDGCRTSYRNASEADWFDDVAVVAMLPGLLNLTCWATVDSDGEATITGLGGSGGCVRSLRWRSMYAMAAAMAAIANVSVRMLTLTPGGPLRRRQGSWRPEI